MHDSILSGLREYEMSRRKSIKVRTFPGATINHMKFFAVPLLNDAPHFTPDEMLKDMKELRLLTQKWSSQVIYVDKANSDINDKKFISLVKSTDFTKH